MTVAEKIAENAKDSNIVATTGFSKSMPAAFDPDGLLKKGDSFTIPATFVWEGDNRNCGRQKFGTNFAEFVVCEITKKDGSKTAFNFFPSSFTKNLFVSEMENGQVKLKLPVLNPSGTAVTKFLEFRGKVERDAEGNITKTDVAFAMEALAGKTIKVTKDTVVKVQKWQAGKALNELKDAHLYEYTLV